MAEKDWIARYFAPLAESSGADSLRDDAAVLHSEGVLVVTTDALVEGVHFLASDPIDTVARKLVRANVSDLIAKGARPTEALLTLIWPQDRGEEELAAFATALGEELAVWSATLVGGDTVSHAGPLTLSLTLMGKCEKQPIRRSGATPGGALYVSGVIGAGGIGLAASQAGEEGEDTRRYRVPEIPPLALADWIAAYAHASMDISDGLLGDLAMLADASEVGFSVDLAQVPLYRPTSDLGRVMAQVTAGDDYQCLIVAPDPLPAMPPVRLSRIGKVLGNTERHLHWLENPVAWPVKAGFEHS